MKYMKMGNYDASVVAMGCMRIAGKTAQQVDTLVKTALDEGVNLFDHADIYGAGKSEEIFSEVLRMNPGLRNKIIIQSKCGIRKGFYDFSYGHITESVDGILKRLGTDHIDQLLFHRPDALAEAEDFSRAVGELKKSGKVLQFGVSNMNPAQIELLEAWTGETLVADQMQLSLMHCGMVTGGLNVNVSNSEGTMYDGSLLPYAEKRGLVIQSWSPFQYGMFEGCFVGNPKFPEVNAKLDELASKYGVSAGTIAVAWLLRIPARMQVVLGTTSPVHLKESCEASNIELTRKEWYELYLAAGYLLP